VPRALRARRANSSSQVLVTCSAGISIWRSFSTVDSLRQVKSSLTVASSSDECERMIRSGSTSPSGRPGSRLRRSVCGAFLSVERGVYVS
jgi:hypothetical protein